MKVKLSDNSIAQIVKLIQMGILTGTDVSDQLRTLELVVEKDQVEPDKEYLQAFEDNLSQMLELADAAVSSETKDKLVN